MLNEESALRKHGGAAKADGASFEEHVRGQGEDDVSQGFKAEYLLQMGYRADNI